MITLNVNRLNYPLTDTEWLAGLKTRPDYMLVSRRHTRSKDRHRLKVKRWKTILQANGRPKKAGVATPRAFPGGAVEKESACQAEDTFFLKCTWNKQVGD